MTDATKQTTRFAFQKIGGSEMLEPTDFNNMLDSLDARINGNPHVAADFTLGTGVAFTYEYPHGMRRLRLTLTNLVLTLAGSTTACCANATLITWPATSNLVIDNARMNLTCVKDGVTLLAADTPSIAVGHAVTALADLSTANAKSTIDAVVLAGTLSAVAQQNGPSSPAARYIKKGASNILNLAAGLSSKAGGTLTVSGTIDVFYREFGNFSSDTA